MQRACPSTPCSTVSRRGRRDRSTRTRRTQRSVCPGSANARSVPPTRALRPLKRSSHARSPQPAGWRPPPGHRTHHPRPHDPRPKANIHHRQGSNNPFGLVPRLSPTQSFRSRITQGATAHSRTAAEALLLVGRLAHLRGSSSPRSSQLMPSSVRAACQSACRRVVRRRLAII